MKNKKSFLKNLLICLLICSSFIIPKTDSNTNYGTNKVKHKTRLIDNWECKKGNIGGIYEVWRHKKHDYLGWNSIKLPHCINAYDAVDPNINYYQGETWYRTLLNVNNPFHNGRTLLHFEGAGQKTNIFAYLTKIGSHTGGYDEFKVDITESFNTFNRDSLIRVRYGGKFPIAICCDNSRDLEMMPSDLSDFNLYGGLYRYVNLEYVPALSIEQLHIQPIVSENKKSAKVQLRLKIYNPEKITEDVDLSVTIKSPTNKIVFSGKVSRNIFEGSQPVFDVNLNRPQFWSPKTPNLYTCNFTLKSKYGSHQLTEHFGVRYFRFEQKGPFYINGERLLLKGTHRHEDHTGVGAAMTEEMIRHEMKLIKEMGVNFIRLGHYQQSSIVLDCCDELGIIVWEEIPWCRGGIGGEKYQDQGKRMLSNMINQHYNHPSVIIWGLGNENDWSGDFETFNKDAIRDYMIELNDLSHVLDSTRKTAIRRCEFCKDIVDIYSPSIWAGWYSGKFTDYKKVSESEMKKVDYFFHAEWGASNHAGRHSENPDKGSMRITSGNNANERDGDFLMTGGNARVSKDGDWTETYACNLIDWHLKEQETMTWLSGTAYWPFKDFSTPLRPDNPVPYVNQKGVVERDFSKKESYYVFQSYWTDKPMVHIYGHTWETRWGDKDEKKLIKVYSNCPEVELYLNNKLISRKKRNSLDYPAAGLRWYVCLKKGENVIKAIGYKNKQKVVDEITQKYQTDLWYKPSTLNLIKYSENGDTLTLKAEVFDKSGVKCLDANNRLQFEIAGDGKLIDNLGTSKGSRIVQLYNGHAYIRVQKNRGNSVVSASVKGIPTVFFSIKD